MCKTAERTGHTEIKNVLIRIMIAAAAVIMLAAGRAGIRFIGMHGIRYFAESGICSEYKEMCCMTALTDDAYGVSKGKTLYEVYRGTLIQHIVSYENARYNDMLHTFVDMIKQKLGGGRFERLEKAYMTETDAYTADKETNCGGHTGRIGLFPQEPQGC